MLAPVLRLLFVIFFVIFFATLSALLALSPALDNLATNLHSTVLTLFTGAAVTLTTLPSTQLATYPSPIKLVAMITQAGTLEALTSLVFPFLPLPFHIG